MGNADISLRHLARRWPADLARGLVPVGTEVASPFLANIAQRDNATCSGIQLLPGGNTRLPKQEVNRSTHKFEPQDGEGR